MLFSKKPRPKSNIQEILEDHLKNVESDNSKTYILVKYVKQDNHIIFYSLPLENNVVVINGVGYVVDEKQKYFMDYKIGDKKTKILFTDIFEGIITAYNPRQDILTVNFNERLEKIVLSYLEEGILNANIRRKMNLQKILLYGFLGVAVVFALLKILNFI